jgi:transcription initiation factor IIF auxiliary subunit
MNIKIRNTWDYVSGATDHYWIWEAFLDDGGSGELSNVDFVEYVLTPSFLDPIQKITDPQGGFRLINTSYGTFTIMAFVYTKDGRKEKLIHNLMLNINPTKGISD